MKIYVSEIDSNKRIEELSDEVRNAVINEIKEYLKNMDGSEKQIQERVKVALSENVAIWKKALDISFVPDKLTFFTFNNLRCQQDGVPSEVKRFENLQDALREYNSLPKEYTTALGGYLGETNCIDFIHRRNGESVLVNDFKKLNDWADNELVKQAIKEIVGQLGVEYESDINSLGYQCPVLIPISDQNKINSYFQDKYLCPSDENNLLSAINEVFVEGNGWIKAKKFLNNLDKISPSKDTYRPKVAKYNVNYVDLNGHYGQADISPADFALLKKQTEERLAQHPVLDNQIKEAAEKAEKQEADTCKDIRAELDELEAFIQGTELAIDYGERLPDEDYKKYKTAIDRRAKLTETLKANEKDNSEPCL